MNKKFKDLKTSVYLGSQVQVEGEVSEEEELWKELDHVAETIRASGITALPEEDLEKDKHLDIIATLSLAFMALYSKFDRNKDGS